MKIKEFELLMTEIKELKEDVKEVRQTDVPGVHTRIAILEERMTELKAKVSKEADRKNKISMAISGVLAIISSVLVSHFRH